MLYPNKMQRCSSAQNQKAFTLESYFSFHLETPLVNSEKFQMPINYDHNPYTNLYNDKMNPAKNS
jgi:hypothetical protein